MHRYAQNSLLGIALVSGLLGGSPGFAQQSGAPEPSNYVPPTAAAGSVVPAFAAENSSELPPLQAASGAPMGEAPGLMALPTVNPVSYEEQRNPTMEDLLRRQENLEAELAGMRAREAQMTGFAPPPAASPNQAALNKRISKLEADAKAAKKKLPVIKLGGFFQLDTGYFTQDVNSRLTYGDIQDGTGFRRTRLQAYGNVAENTNYIIEMDYAIAGRPSFLDVWGEQTNLPFFGAIRIGQFRQPGTMDGLTSIRHLEFLERNASFQSFDPFRRVGIMAYRQSDDERTNLFYSVYKPNFSFWNPVTGASQYGTIGDTRFGSLIGDNGGYAAAIRGTHLLYYNDDCDELDCLHIGAGYSYNQIGYNQNQGPAGSSASGQFYEARTIPGFFVGDPVAGGNVNGGTPFIGNSGQIAANSFNFWHSEFAGNFGRAHFQTEYLATSVNTVGGGNVFLDGTYFQTGYMLTGESIGYNKATGALDYNVKPFNPFFGTPGGMCGWGAWELAYRFDYLDLSRVPLGAIAPNDPAIQAPLTGAGISPTAYNPGILDQHTLALNWWWNQYTRVQFNYIVSDYNSALYGKNMTDTYALRFQVEF